LVELRDHSETCLSTGFPNSPARASEIFIHSCRHCINHQRVAQFAVPELTRNTSINLNARSSLRRQANAITSLLAITSSNYPAIIFRFGASANTFCEFKFAMKRNNRKMPNRPSDIAEQLRELLQLRRKVRAAEIAAASRDRSGSNEPTARNSERNPKMPNQSSRKFREQMAKYRASRHMDHLG